MKIERALQTIEDNIEDLESGIYRVESVVLPRYEKEKEILEKLREQHLKLMTLKEKAERGEDITDDEIYEAVPEQFWKKQTGGMKGGKGGNKKS